MIVITKANLHVAEALPLVAKKMITPPLTISSKKYSQQLLLPKRLLVDVVADAIASIS
jgi:hypothetical protein